MGSEISDELSWLYRQAAEVGEKALAAWIKAVEGYEPSGTLSPEQEQIAKCEDIAWALLVPMGEIRLAIAAIEAHVAHQQVVRTFATMGHGGYKEVKSDEDI